LIRNIKTAAGTGARKISCWRFLDNVPLNI